MTRFEPIYESTDLNRFWTAAGDRTGGGWGGEGNDGGLGCNDGGGWGGGRGGGCGRRAGPPGRWGGRGGTGGGSRLGGGGGSDMIAEGSIGGVKEGWRVEERIGEKINKK